MNTKNQTRTNNNINDFLIKKTTKTIEVSLDVANSLKESIVIGQQHHETQSFASLIQAITIALDFLNKLNLQK